MLASKQLPSERPEFPAQRSSNREGDAVVPIARGKLHVSVEPRDFETQTEKDKGNIWKELSYKLTISKREERKTMLLFLLNLL